MDGAIHRAAGPQLLAHCRKLEGCPTGEAKLTPGFQLKAKHIIHTVGPVYRDGKSNEALLLGSCYRKSLEIALVHKINSISFPSISTGAYRYPLKEASQIALTTVIDFLQSMNAPPLVRFVLFGSDTFGAYVETLEEGVRKLRNKEP